MRSSGGKCDHTHVIIENEFSLFFFWCLPFKKFFKLFFFLWHKLKWYQVYIIDSFSTAIYSNEQVGSRHFDSLGQNMISFIYLLIALYPIVYMWVSAFHIYLFCRCRYCMLPLSNFNEMYERHWNSKQNLFIGKAVTEWCHILFLFRTSTFWRFVLCMNFNKPSLIRFNELKFAYGIESENRNKSSRCESFNFF